MGYVACLGQIPEETAHVLQNLVSANGLMKKHASTAPPQIQYYILHLLNGCSTINSTTVRLLGLLSDVS